MKLRNAIAAFGVASAMAVGAASPALADQNGGTDNDPVDEIQQEINEPNDNTGLWGLAGLAGLLGLLGLRKRPTEVVDRTVTRNTGTGSTTGTNR